MSFTESEINPSYPTERDATTASVRDNFAIAQREITAINEAISTALTGAPYLSIAGGELTGRLLLPGAAPDHLRAAVTQGWVQSYVAGETGAGVPEAPNDGTLWARKNLLWSPAAAADDLDDYLPLTGGVLTGGLTVGGDGIKYNVYDWGGEVIAFGYTVNALRLAIDGAFIGNVALEADVLPIYGGTLMGGISFGSRASSTPDDLSQHIALFGGSHGLSATLLRQNYVIGLGGSHVFRVNAVDIATINSSGLSLSRGLNFGNYTADAPDDLSRHISLWGGFYGFNVTDSGLNYNTWFGANHAFYVGESNLVTINALGVNVTGDVLATNVQASDGLYSTWVNTVVFVASGSVKVRDPETDDEAASKGYVDAALAALLERVTALEARR